MKNIELLAPAGAMESLIAAVNGGANAVYLGGSSFGARKSASNFNEESIIEAVKFCHLNNVAVYITVNTLIKDDEMEACFAFINFLYNHDVDAVILQDYGVLKLVKEHFPDFDCHASTQMTFHSVEDVLFAQKAGFNRVVVARELSIDEIKAIRAQSDIELEVFVHGALCIAYSGNCLMSSMIGGRSGNRGGCAQPCRKPYDLLKLNQDLKYEKVSTSEQIYLLSPKDLSALDLLDDLKTISNIALKIEGRMKGPDYVYNVISHYRHALDSNEKTKSKDHMDLLKSFNRQFTKGHLGKASYEVLMNYELPGYYGTLVGKVLEYKDQMLEFVLFDELNKGDEIQFREKGKTVGARTDVIYRGQDRVDTANKGDVIKVPFKHPLEKYSMLYKTYDKVFIDEMNRLGKESLPVYGLSLYFEAKEGAFAQLKGVLDHPVHQEAFTVASSKITEKAIKVALDENRVTEQLIKLGGTSFWLNQIEVILDSDISMPVSEINKMRRQITDYFSEKLMVWHEKRDVSNVLKFNEKASFRQKNQRFSVDSCYNFYVTNKEQLDLFLNSKIQVEHQIFYSDLEDYTDHLNAYRQENIVPVLPKIIKGNTHEVVNAFLKSYFDGSKKGGQKISISHLGHLQLLDSIKNAEIITEESMNIFNAETADAMQASVITPSVELTYAEVNEMIKRMKNSKEIQFFVYGRIPVMTSDYCVVGGALEGHNHCGHCVHNEFALKDDKGAIYPLICDPKDCRMKVLMNKPIFLLDELHHLLEMGISQFKISLEGATIKEVKTVLKAFNQYSESKSLMEFFDSFDPDLQSRGHFRKATE